MPYKYKFIYNVEMNDIIKADLDKKLENCNSLFDCYLKLIEFFKENYKENYSFNDLYYLVIESKNNKEDNETYIKFDLTNNAKNIASWKINDALNTFINQLLDEEIKKAIKELNLQQIYKGDDCLEDDLKNILDESSKKEEGKYDKSKANIEIVLKKFYNLVEPADESKRTYYDNIKAKLYNLDEIKILYLSDILVGIIEKLLSKVNDVMDKIIINFEWEEAMTDKTYIKFKPHIIRNIWDYRENVGNNNVDIRDVKEYRCETKTCTINIPLMAVYIRAEEDSKNGLDYCSKEFCQNFDSCKDKTISCMKFYNLSSALFADPIESNKFNEFIKDELMYEIDINNFSKNVTVKTNEGGKSKQVRMYNAELYEVDYNPPIFNWDRYNDNEALKLKEYLKSRCNIKLEENDELKKVDNQIKNNNDKVKLIKNNGKLTLTIEGVNEAEFEEKADKEIYRKLTYGSDLKDSFYYSMINKNNKNNLSGLKNNKRFDIFLKFLILIKPISDLYGKFKSLPKLDNKINDYVFIENTNKFPEYEEIKYFLEVGTKESDVKDYINQINKIKTTLHLSNASIIYTLSENNISPNFIFEKASSERGHGIGRADEIEENSDLYRWKFEGSIENLKKKLKEIDPQKENSLNIEKLGEFFNLDKNKKISTGVIKIENLIDSPNKYPQDFINVDGKYFVRCNTPYPMKLNNAEKPRLDDKNTLLNDIKITYYRNVADFEIKRGKNSIKVKKVIKNKNNAKNKPKDLRKEYQLGKDQLGLNLPSHGPFAKNTIKKAPTKRPIKGRNFFPIENNKRTRLDAGRVMSVEADKLQIAKQSSLSATTFAHNVISKYNDAHKDWKDLKDTDLENLPTDQEWCHLQGHGDNGAEVQENFVSGSNHCNTEQLAIELGHRPTTHKDANKYHLKSEAYLLIYKKDDGAAPPKRQKIENNIKNHEQTDEKAPPLAAFIRYKIFKSEDPNPTSRKKLVKLFDYTFEAQSEFFDKNQYNIINKTVEYIFNPDGFIEKLGNFLDETAKGRGK